MEVYINDMLVKSLKAIDHIVHLEELFGILRKHRMMLKPSKYIFGDQPGDWGTSWLDPSFVDNEFAQK